MKTERDFYVLLGRLRFPGFEYRLCREAFTKAPQGFYLQIRCAGTCNVTGADLSWSGRKWRLSVHMTDSEVIQTAFMATMAAVEHETRETFTYKGVSVFDPHYDVEKLVRLRVEHDAISERAPANA